MRPSLVVASLLGAFFLGSCASRPTATAPGAIEDGPSPCIAGLVETGPGVFTVDTFIRYAGIETMEWTAAELAAVNYPPCQ